MKNLYLFILFLVSITQHVMSQTATGTITQPPCNNDGIYSVTTSGIPLPITYVYYMGYAGEITVVHPNVNSATDQLTNFGMSNDGYISCKAYNGNVYAYAEDVYTPAFSFEIFSTDPVCPVTMGTITANQVSGTTGPFSFVWTNTQTSISYTGNNPTVPLGDYSGVITDQTTGCLLQVSDSSTSIQQASDITASISTTTANCTNGTATATPSGGIAPYSYAWGNGATSATVTGLSSGYYPVVITDAQGCQSNYLGAEITQNPQIHVNTTVTNATCIQPNGSATAFGSGGVTPYTYSWSNGQTGNTASNLSGDSTYIVVATDANSCVGQGHANISTNTPITVTYSSTPSQCLSPTGSATLSPSGGTAPYTYSWDLYLSVSGPTLTNVAPGTYSFKVTDAVNCIRTGTVIVPPISTITAHVAVPTIVCPATTGTATVVVSGTNGPFSYLWSNGATTDNISGVPLGAYSCLVTDALGCSVTKLVGLNAISPVKLGVSTVPTTCFYNTDGSATAIVSGGTPPYTYTYTSGATTPTASNLGVGRYVIDVSDANQCGNFKHFCITDANTAPDCYCTISGTVYVDANADCVHDPGETGVENLMMHCSGFGYTFTDANGHYSFKVPTGTYIISEQVNQYYPMAACQSNMNTVSVVAASGCNTAVDFANVINPLHDLKLVTINATIPPIPGNDYQQKVIVKNRGTVTEPGIQLGYTYDGQLTFLNSTSPGFIQLNGATAPYSYGIQSGFPSLSPNDRSVMLLNFNTPTSIPLGTDVNFYDSVAHAAPIATNWLLDNAPWNNVNAFQTTVVGSFDPNYKEVSPKGEGAAGNISTDTREFDYTVHFQNEGTYFAQNIYVTDQLDADFDWTTFTPGYSDNNYSTTVSETGLVTFTFPNINLPWKDGYGDALSSGLINYSIRRKTTTPIGTEFTNTANIYFDYNAPITTNTTLNTLNSVAGINEAGADVDGVTAFTVDLYPVPVSDQLTIRVNNVSKSETATVRIIDLTGNVLMSDNIDLGEGSTVITKNLSKLMTGTYLTRIEFESGSVITKKIVFYNNK